MTEEQMTLIKTLIKKHGISATDGEWTLVFLGACYGLTEKQIASYLTADTSDLLAKHEKMLCILFGIEPESNGEIQRMENPAERLQMILAEYLAHNQSVGNQSKQGYEEVLEYVIRDTGLSAAQIEQLRKAVEVKMPAEDVLPSFNQGQEMEEKSSVPEPVPEQTVGKVLSLEKMKERYQSPEYIPVTFDMETQMVAESPNLYIANLPKEPQESKDFIRCISLDKTAVSVSEDGKRLQAYLKRSETSEVREIDLEGKELRKYSKKNEDIAAECLKYQRSRGRERQPVPEEILRHKPDVNLKKR